MIGLTTIPTLLTLLKLGFSYWSILGWALIDVWIENILSGVIEAFQVLKSLAKETHYKLSGVLRELLAVGSIMGAHLR